MRVIHLPLRLAGLAVVPVVVAVSAAVLAAAPAPPTYEQVSLSATVTGGSMVARTTVRASEETRADRYGVCVRSAKGANVDFEKSAATITTDGTAYVSRPKVFAPGTYTYFSCLHAHHDWHDVGATKSFTVGPRDDRFELTRLSVTVRGSRVEASTRVRAAESVEARHFRVCVRDAEGREADFPDKEDVRIGSSGSSWSGHRSLPSGTYAYFACVQLRDGSWWNSAASTFTVGGSPSPSSSTTTTSSTPPTTPPTTSSSSSSSSSSSTSSSSSSSSSSSTSSGSPTTSGARVTKLLTIVVENHSLRRMKSGMPYLYGLAQQFSYADHYSATTHPSLPNYLAIAGGSTFGVRNNGEPAAHRLNGSSVFGQAVHAGLTAGTYAESMSRNCLLTGNKDKGYAVKHNPQAYFVDERATCATTNVPETSFVSDARNDRLPNVAMLVPNKCNDAHDEDLGCTLGRADSWLRTRLTAVLASPDFTSGRLAVVVTADEDDNTQNNLVLTVVLHQSLRGAHLVVSQPLNHYSLSRLYSQVVGVEGLREARDAHDMAAAFRLPVG